MDITNEHFHYYQSYKEKQSYKTDYNENANDEDADDTFNTDNIMELLKLIVNSTLLVVGIVANCMALEGAVKGRFRLPGYRRFLISLLTSDLYICGANGVLMWLSTLGEQFSNHFSYCFIDVIQRIATTGVLANILNFVILSFDHFTQVVYPHAYNILGSESVANLVISITWILSIATGFADYPIRSFINWYTTPEAKFTYVEQNFTTFPMAYPNYPASTDGYFYNNGSFFEIIFEKTTTPSKYLPIPGKAKKLHSNTDKRGRRSTTTTTTQLPELINYVESSSSDVSFVPCDNSALSPNNLYRISMELCVLLLAITLMVFLVILCCIVVRETTRLPTRRRLRRSMITAILLLGCFISCWAPIVCYELMLVVPEILDDLYPNSHISFIKVLQNTLTADLDAIIHPICFSIFMFSPITPPIIFIFRNQQIHRYLVHRYSKCCGGYAASNDVMEDLRRTQPRFQSFNQTNSVDAPLLCRISTGPAGLEGLAMNTMVDMTSVTKLSPKSSL